MGKALLAVCLLSAAACQGMYDQKADTLKNPPARARPKVVDTQPDPVFVDACTVDFTAKATKQRAKTVSASLTNQGNTALQNAQPPAPRPSTASGIQTVQDAITKYREALIKDPYNPEATLKLALAYDRVLRKGCALAMLHRLDTLASNPTFQPDATPMVDLVVQNPHWFSPYHNDALKAVGR